MILTGNEIGRAVEAQEIVISPFNDTQVGPNSYDFRLGTRCRTYENVELDARYENPTVEQDISPEGLLLDPGRLYLVNTEEVIGSTRYVPIIRGRSSTGRLGIFVHITADLIDIGSINQLTLQLHAVAPVRIFAGMLIGQVTFWTVQGKIELYNGKYSKLQSPAGSLGHTEF